MCGSNSSMWKVALQSMMGLSVLGGALFFSAGRLDIPFFWACLAVMAVGGIVVVSQMDPELRDERVRPGPGGIDRHLRVTILPLFIGHLVIAGLDVGRYEWSGRLPVAVQVVALLEVIVSISFSAWAVRTNRFFFTGGAYSGRARPSRRHIGSVSMDTPSRLRSGSLLDDGQRTGARVLVFHDTAGARARSYSTKSHHRGSFPP